jgi:PTH1 family peptidyl-tRNA hydrolase
VIESLAAARGVTLRRPFLRSYEYVRTASSLTLARPLTFMNRSGEVMRALLRRAHASISDVVVICDNLDLPPGSVRVKRRGSARSHNGLASIMDALGTGEFLRIYIGIGRPAPGVTVVEHVLGVPPDEETEAYERAILAAASAVERLVDEPVDAVMNSVNASA